MSSRSVSRVLSMCPLVANPWVNHLSTRHVTVTLYRPTLRWSACANVSVRAVRHHAPGTGRPEPSVYLDFQRPRYTPHAVTGTVGGLLHAPSHPYPRIPSADTPYIIYIRGTDVAEGGCFLLYCLALADYFPLRSGLPCVARTFLYPGRHVTSTSLSDMKNTHVSRQRLTVRLFIAWCKGNDLFWE